MADLFSRPEALLAALLLLAAALGVLALFGPRLRVLARRARARSRELLGRDPGPGAWPDVLERALEGMGAELARLQAETAWMEQERRRAERFFSDVFDAVSDGIAVLDTDLRLVRANAALRGIYGEEMLGRPCREVFPQRRAVDCERCPARDAMRRRRPVRREVAFRRPDGGAGVLELAAFPLLSPGGELTGAVEFSRDVTERAELTRVRRRWEFMVNTAPDPMTLISAEGRLESANQAYCRASGRSEAELTGRTMAELWGETAWESLIRPSLERALAGEAVVREAWFRFPGLPEPGYYEVSYHPYFGAGGAVRGAVVVSHDITARHQAETALRRAHDELEARVAERTAELTRLNAELLTEITERRRLERSLVQAKEAAERADRAKGEFLANMSHEVRTPLSAIIGLAEIGRDTAGPEPSQLFAQVLSESGALLGVLNAVLDYSKIESGHLELEHIPFNLRYLVEDLAAGFAVQCARKGLELIAAVAPDAPERLVGDPGRLRQALANLVNNAVKFTDRGEVAVWVERAPGGDGPGAADRDGVLLRLNVRDTGIGIPEDRQRAIFESFTQADGSTTRRYGGTGLGTTIAKQLAGLMGGEIGLASRPGRGSLFWFTARLAEQQGPGPAVREAVDLPGLRVLLVDDNAMARRATAEQLEHWGCRVLEAGGAATALALLERARAEDDPVDLAVTDLTMPDMDGFGLARAIRAAGPLRELPIILMTAATAIGHGDLCREVGIDGYLSKPVRSAELNQAIRSVLALSRGQASGGAPLVTRHSLAEAHRPRGRVLVVEDYAPVRDVLLRHLRSFGLEPDMAPDGPAAVERFARARYDLVLMDVQMPGMDGMEATRAIRRLEARKRGLAGAAEDAGAADGAQGDAAGTDAAETGAAGAAQPGRVPVVALTGHTTEAIRRQCAEAGMDDRVVKPVTRARLLELLQRWLPAGPEAAGPEAAGPEADGRDAAGPEADGAEAAGPEADGREADGVETPGMEAAGPEATGPEADGAESTAAPARAPEAPDQTPPLDLARALEEFQRDEAFVQALARSFLQTLDPALKRMAGLAAEGRWEPLAGEAHTLKGGALSLAADPLARAARALERHARAGDAAAAAAALDRLAAETRRLAAFLEPPRPA